MVHPVAYRARPGRIPRWRSLGRTAGRRRQWAEQNAHRSRGRSRWVRAAQLAVVAALTVPALTGCSVEEVLRFGWPVGVTPQAESMRHLWTWSAVAALVVGAITWGAMFWAVVFHRKRTRRRRHAAPPDPVQPARRDRVHRASRRSSSRCCSASPCNVQNYVDKADPSNGPRPDPGRVTAFQWNWKFDYPDQTARRRAPGQHASAPASTIPLLVLPTDRSIQFTQRSNDVIHTFFVPEFLFKRDVFPLPEKNDQDNTWRDRPDRRARARSSAAAPSCAAPTTRR